MREATKKRSIVKSITWRILASITTVLIVLIIGGDLNFALSVGIVEVVAKMMIYYSHERAWNKVRWGKEL